MSDSSKDFADTTGPGDVKTLKGMRDGLPDPDSSRGRRMACTLASIVGLIVLGMVIWPSLVQGWGEALGWIFAEQSRFQRSLGRAMSELSAHPGTPWALIGLSFIYGVLHAAGPGHGKVVISTLLASQPIVRRRALWLSLLAALLQGISALVLVGLGAGLLDWAGRDVLEHVGKVTLVSHLGVLVLGLLLLWRAARALWQVIGEPSASHTQEPEAPVMQGLSFDYAHGHHHADAQGHAHSHTHSHTHDCGCGHAHGVTAEQASGDWRTMGMAVLAIGLRPCSGAILVLLAALALDMVGSGVLAVLAMSLGTALTVSSVAVATLLMKASGRLAIGGTGGERKEQGLRHWPWAALIGLLGGIIITLFGTLLVASSLKAMESPTSRGASPFGRSVQSAPTPPGAASLSAPLSPARSSSTPISTVKPGTGVE